MLTAHRKFPRFYHALNAPTWFCAWQGEAFRQALPKWVSLPYRFTGAGSVLAGGRWSVRRLMPAVYASLSPDTLHAEAFYQARHYGWTLADFKPQTMIGLRCEFHRIVDLTSRETLKVLGVKTKELVDCNWRAEQAADLEPLTQAIARAAFENLAEGLLVPSARHADGINLVYFPSHRRDGTRLEADKESDIPFVHGI